jgi:GTP-binding protein
MRASGKDDAILLTPPVRYTLEEAMEFLDDDELLEITPGAIRLRKRHLTENARVLAAKVAAKV